MTELGLGIAGLGGAASLVLPYLNKVPGVRFVGAADIRPEARTAFQENYDLPAYESVEALCAAPDIDVLWVETPNHLHCAHTLEAIRQGKHVICAKPVGTTLQECDRMIEAADRAGVQILQGHSKVFDTPLTAMREVVRSGRIGRVVQVDTWLFNNWLQRPRLAEELDARLGGGIALRQAPHQIDILRYLAGGRALDIRAIAGRWDRNFDTEGNYSLLMGFENGVGATAVFNGYGYFDSTELTWGIDPLGVQKEVLAAAAPDPRNPRRTRTLDASEKYSGTGLQVRAQGVRMPFFGLTVVSCERGAIRQSPEGLLVYSESGCEALPAPAPLGRAAELLEMRAALEQKRSVFPDARWGKATLEACLAILESSREHRDVKLRHQTSVP